MTVRLFAALDIPSKMLERLIAVRKSIYDDAKLKWEAIEKLHLTLKFFGDVHSNKIDDIFVELKRISQHYFFIESFFTKFGLFYRNNKPVILWAGIYSSPKLTSLVSNINEGMEKFGFEKDKRKFRPHLTLLRLKGNEEILKINRFNNHKIQLDNILFNNIKLIKSELKPQGSHYHVIDEISLRN